MVESISIHALREEGDVIWHTETDSSIISIHALREEGDPRSAQRPAVDTVFLSTPSARRATPKICISGNRYLYFYPRPPRGGRRHNSGVFRA